MLGKTHLVIGLTTLAGLNAVTPLVQPHRVDNRIPAGPLLCMLATILGSLAPDLDADEAQVQTELGEVGLAVSTWLRAWGVQHRGLTHSGLMLLVVLAASAGLGWVAGYPDVGLAFGLGYLSHLVADSLTLAGTPLLWPLRSAKPFHLLPRPLRLRTGGPVEPLVFLLVTALLIALLPTLIPAALFRFGL